MVGIFVNNTSSGTISFEERSIHYGTQEGIPQDLQVVFFKYVFEIYC